MFKHNLIYLFILVLVPFSGFGQYLTGSVQDEGNVPIAFATVNVVGTNAVTVSNEVGEFSIKLTNEFPAKLKVSHLSYNTSIIDVADPGVQLTVKLKLAATNLASVDIRAVDPKETLKKAFEKVKPYLGMPTYAKAFYRQLTYVNEEPKAIHEIFFNVNWNLTNVKGWNAKQGRSAEVKSANSFYMDNQSSLTFWLAAYIFDDLEEEFINTLTFDKFIIQVEKYIEQNDQDIIVISCKRKEASIKNLYINTTYYIGLNDYNIYQVDNQVKNLEVAGSGKVKYTGPPEVTSVATFNTEFKPFPVLQNITVTSKVNTISKGTEAHAIIKSQLMVYNINPALANQKYQSIDKSSNDFKLISSMQYNPEIWKNNPIVKRTPPEDAFIEVLENQKAFEIKK